MNTSHSVFIKRLRMQVDLSGIAQWLDSFRPEIAAQSNSSREQGQVVWLPWHSKLIGAHAQAKWESFRHEMDGSVFACLADREGCRQLMRDLAGRTDFVPEATWLAILRDEQGNEQPLATIQGLLANHGYGSIQNIGVIPSWRGRGLGKELLRRCLSGYRDNGCRSVSLEVTTHNLAAIRLYESVGFRVIETVFKYCYLY